MPASNGTSYDADSHFGSSGVHYETDPFGSGSFVPPPCLPPSNVPPSYARPSNVPPRTYTFSTPVPFNSGNLRPFLALLHVYNSALFYFYV